MSKTNIEKAKFHIVEMILSNQLPAGSSLPGERDLAEQLGVTRPTLRETLQWLAAEGWVEIQHGKSTRVKNYLEEGNVSILATLANHRQHLPGNFIIHLLEVRLAIAPSYAQMAVEKGELELYSFLLQATHISDEAPEYVQTDWALHMMMSKMSGNPVFKMILNGFEEMYITLGSAYFFFDETRKESLKYYLELLYAVENKNPEIAEIVTKKSMEKSIELYKKHLGRFEKNGTQTTSTSMV